MTFTAILPEVGVKPVVEVSRVTADSADAVAEFMRRVWGSNVSGERVRRWVVEAARTNPAVTGEGVPAVVYLRDGEAIGYLGSIPVRLWNGSVESTAHWLKGFMVLPEHQNGPVGFALLREMLRHVEVSGTMTVALPARRLFQAVGFVDCGAMPNYIGLLSAGRVAASVDLPALGLELPKSVERAALFAQRSGVAFIGGAAAGLVLRAWKGLRRPGFDLSTDLSGSLPARNELDELWARARTNIRAGAVRDGRYLCWRYEAAPGAQYEAVSIRERRGDQRLRAVAIVRRSTETPDPRLRGIKVATLADIVFDPNDSRAGQAAVAAAERAAGRMGADAILCSTAHPAIARVLRGRGFLELAGNVRLMLREPRGAANLSRNATEWWLMRGDANSDEAF